MTPPEEQNEMLSLLKENTKLLQENTALLKKIHRWNLAGFYLRIFWYALLVGLPFALYFYVFEPYFTAFGSDYEVFRAGIGEIPGLKGIMHMLPAVGN